MESLEEMDIKCHYVMFFYLRKEFYTKIVFGDWPEII